MCSNNSLISCTPVQSNEDGSECKTPSSCEVALHAAKRMRIGQHGGGEAPQKSWASSAAGVKSSSAAEAECMWRSADSETSDSGASDGCPAENAQHESYLAAGCAWVSCALIVAHDQMNMLALQQYVEVPGGSH